MGEDISRVAHFLIGFAIAQHELRKKKMAVAIVQISLPVSITLV